MANRYKSKHVNKKHMARMQKERKQIRTITLTAIIVIASVIVLVLFGVLGQTVFQARQPVAEVGGESISTKSFDAHVRLLRQQLINQYLQYLQFSQMFGLDPSTNPTVGNALQQIQSQLDDSASLGEGVLNQMIDNILIRQEANRMEISVTSEEIEKAIMETLGYTPDGTPTPTTSPTAITYPTLNPTQLVLFPPSATPTVIPSSTPTSETTKDITPTSGNVSSTATVIPTNSPTETPFTFDGYQNLYQEMLDSYDSFGLTEADALRLFEDGLYRDKLFPLITADVPRSAEMVWARHILVVDEATANKVRNGLLDGISWSSLALEYSTDTGSSSKGGDLGWFQRGVMIPEFENESFRLEIGEISQPIETTYGFHIIQVLGNDDNRPLTSDEYLSKADQVFTNWIAGIRESTDIVIHDYYKDRIPVEPRLQDALGQ
ncbi:peptidylprolyl isomerase [Chloroflexota bacterium]